MSRNDVAKPQVEHLQFQGVIINRSDKQIGGTGDLSRGNWIPGELPRFPISKSFGTMSFASQGVSTILPQSQDPQSYIETITGLRIRAVR